MTLLFDAKPITVQPDLAIALGSLDEAAVLQQLDYWLGRSKHQIDGRPWVYNTIEDWLMHFPWIKSSNTMRRYFKDLMQRGLVVTGNFNRLGFDRTRWYTINYQRVQAFKEDFYQKIPEDLARLLIDGVKGSHPAARRKQKKMTKKAASIEPKSLNGCTRNRSNNTREYPEKNTDINTETVAVEEEIPYQEILNYLNQKSGHQFKANDYNCRFIRALWQKGYRLADFKKVVDNKCAAWLGVNTRDGRPLGQFLRPSTLFGEKFERYLEETVDTCQSRSERFAVEFGEFWKQKYAEQEAKSTVTISNEELRQRMQKIDRAIKADYERKKEAYTDWAKVYEDFDDTIDISDEELREQLRKVNPDR